MKKQNKTLVRETKPPSRREHCCCLWNTVGKPRAPQEPFACEVTCTGVASGALFRGTVFLPSYCPPPHFQDRLLRLLRKSNRGLDEMRWNAQDSDSPGVDSDGGPGLLQGGWVTMVGAIWGLGGSVLWLGSKE